MIALDEARIRGVYDMLQRTGAASIVLRHVDDEVGEDEDPGRVVWLAVGDWVADGERRWEAGTGHDPLQALTRLCTQVMDGGRCTHCDRPTMFLEDVDEGRATILERLICVTSWDPELSTYRRECEGDAP